MPLTKIASIRYKILDTCFRNPGKRYFIEDLLYECAKVLKEMNPDISGISRRTILADIAFMESGEGWSIDLERTRVNKRVFYRYSDLSFSINNMPLNKTDLFQLKDALGILAQFRGMPQFDWINEMLPKLHNGLQSQEDSIGLMEFEKNEDYKGHEFLGEIFNAIYNKRVLKVKYQPYTAEEPSILTLHPYLLKSYNQRWFLFGYNPEYGRYDWNLAVDRIESFEETNQTYTENNTINWQDYFYDIIGVTKPEGKEVEKVVVHIKGIRAKYAATKPLHGSQIPRWIDESTLQLTLRIIINREFVNTLLSFGADVIVIEPQTLRHSMLHQFKACLANYADKAHN
jgi:predicted DNA-binding transcriptional regulator YafY